MTARPSRLWPLVYLPVPLLALWGVVRYEGWPVNHELYIHFERVEAFRRAYRAGDWFPAWTAFAEHGHGDALPFFYHRLFNTIGSLFAITTGSTYFAVKLSVYLVMLVGLWGMDRAIADLGGSRLHRFLGACLVALSNYALVDWMVRGSTAELTAFMLMPWVFLYLLRALRAREGGVGLGLSLALLFFAHSAIFYFAVLMLGPIVAAQLVAAHRRREALGATLRPFVVGAVACAVVCGPYVVAIAVIGRAFSLSELTRAWSPLRFMQPIGRYFFDPSLGWSPQFRFEVGTSVLVAVALLAAVALRVRARVNRTVVATLLFALVFCFWLQTPLAGRFYRSFPGAGYLGFPWRLLCTLTVAFVLLLCHLAARVARAGRGPRLIADVVLVLAASYQVAFSLVAQERVKARYTRADIQAHLDALDLVTVGEYVPNAVGGRRGLPAQSRPFVSGPGCVALSVAGSGDPARNVHIQRVPITVTSTHGCQVALDQFTNPFLAVESDAAVSVTSSPQHTIVVQVPPGVVRFTLVQRSLWAVTWGELRRWLSPSAAP
jgi:hypothetical protein